MKKYFTTLFLFCFIVSCNKDEEVITIPPEINKFYNQADTIGANLTIIGQNFSRFPENNKITFEGGVETTSYSWSNGNEDTIQVIIPDGAKTGQFSVEVYERKVFSGLPISIVTGDFKKMEPIPIKRHHAVSFAINGKGYVCTGEGTNGVLGDLWEYDPETNRWTRKANMPGPKRSGAFSFVINGKAYVGGGYDLSTDLNDFYSYDPETDTWEMLANYPSYARELCKSFVLNNKGYLLGNEGTRQFWLYNPETNTWNERASFPINISHFSEGTTINGKAYAFARNELNDLYEYDPNLDSWKLAAEIPNFPYESFFTARPCVFKLDGKMYITNGLNNYQYTVSFDISNYFWNQKIDFPGESFGFASSFVIDGSAYIVGGTTFDNFATNEVWKFTP